MTRRRWIVSSLGLSVASAAYLVASRLINANRPEATRCPRSEAPTTLRVVTFNAQFLPGVAGLLNKRPLPDYRARALAERLDGFDVVGLNEMFDPRARRSFLGALARRGTFYCATPPPGQRTWLGIDSGLVIASRFPIVAIHSVVFSKASGFRDHGIYADGFAAKGVLHARILRGEGASGGEIDVFVTHLEARDTRVRASQYDELSRFIGRHGDPGRPALVLGDFNTSGGPPELRDPASPYHLMLAALNRSRPFAPVLDVWTCLRGDGPEGGTSDPTTPGQGRRIDYIFISNSAADTALDPVGVAVNPFADPKVGTLSDHAAVEATLRFRPRFRTAPAP